MKECKQHKPLNISLTALFIAALVVLMITFSIGLPIYCRFFYYLQIKTLRMEEQTGWDYATIKAAYDDVLNFCTLPGRPFGTGALKWTEEEAAHFADCKVLFDLNFWGLLVSAITVTTLALLHRFKVITILRPLKHRAYFWAAIIAVALPVVIGLLCLIAGFEKAFRVFHSIFFPGKENWQFNPDTEQVIQIMPEQFFLNCAIIIGVALFASACSFIAADLILMKKDKRGGERDESDNRQ